MNKLLFELRLTWDYDIVMPVTIMTCVILYDIMYAFRWLTNSNFRQRKMSLNLFQVILYRQHLKRVLLR
jgi:hypothetical protein